MTNSVRKALSAATLAAGLLVGASGAHATVYEIDFTDASSFGGVNGNSTFGPLTIDGAKIFLSSVFGQAMSFNSGGSEPAGCLSAGTSMACDGDGLGIMGGANGDEVDSITNALEALRIDFGGSKIVHLLGFELLDLFLSEQEVAGVSFDLGGLVPLDAQTDLGGYAVFQGKVSNIGSLVFMTQVPGSDFAVARITIEVVPEPATLALIGGGLVGVAWLRRRRRTQ